MVGVNPVASRGMIGIDEVYAHLPVPSAHVSSTIATSKPPRITTKDVFTFNFQAIKNSNEMIMASTTAALVKIKLVIVEHW